MKAIPPVGEIAIALGMWGSRISGHIFGNGFDYNPKVDVKADSI